MRRADRLFRIVQVLRRRRLVTAQQLADRLEVSLRTVYRDISDLISSGVPIEGEAGVGYRMAQRAELPPLMFTVDEVQALVLGARMVESWADDGLRGAARSALDKIEAVLPDQARLRIDGTPLFAISFAVPPAVRQHMGPLRRAIDERRVVALSYRDARDAASDRRVRPLGLWFWGGTWTLGGWCELRTAFRNFRLDRVGAVTLTEDRFEHTAPVTLAAYVEAMSADRP